MALTAKLLNHYRKETGTVVYRYAVNGSAEEIKQYEEATGDNLKHDDSTGKPIYFTTRYVADNIKLRFTDKGQVITDDTDITKLQSLVQQYGVDVARLILSQNLTKPSADE